ncbi:hypothetical protein Hanom_Chr02g00106561 [Helianthus anomalus]
MHMLCGCPSPVGDLPFQEKIDKCPSNDDGNPYGGFVSMPWMALINRIKGSMKVTEKR